MRIRMIKPSATEAVLEKSGDDNVVIEVQPRRWSQKQQYLTVLPMETVANTGAVLDSAMLMVHQRTGRISIIRDKDKSNVAELPCDADRGAVAKKKG